MQNGGGNNMPKNTETTNETNAQDATRMLVGYVRRSGAGGARKVSIDTEAIQACSTTRPAMEGPTRPSSFRCVPCSACSTVSAR